MLDPKSLENLKLGRITKTRICKNCNGDYTNSNGHRSEAFCADCKFSNKSEYIRHRKEQFKFMTLGDYQTTLALKGKHPSWRSAQIRSFNRSWNRHLIKRPCIICGYKKHIELAHIRDIASFPSCTTLGEVNAELNNLPLCRNHHWEFDNEKLDDVDWQKIKHLVQDISS